MAVASDEDGEQRVADVGGAGERWTLDFENVVHESNDRERGERVEHDRRDDFVGTRECLERTGDEPVRGSGEGAGDDRERDRDGNGLIGDGGADQRGGESPTKTCPDPPMLKSPALKPTPTASPVKTSGVAATSVLTIPFSLPNAPLSSAP